MILSTGEKRVKLLQRSKIFPWPSILRTEATVGGILPAPAPQHRHAAGSVQKNVDLGRHPLRASALEVAVEPLEMFGRQS